MTTRGFMIAVAAIIHNVLNEFLAGWVFEVRKEFGPELEGEVVRMTERLRR